MSVFRLSRLVKTTLERAQSALLDFAIIVKSVSFGRCVVFQTPLLRLPLDRAARQWGGGGPDGSKVYVANFFSNTVSVIATSSNTVIATIPVGSEPSAFGVFIPILVPQTAPVAGNRCNGIYNGTFSGNLSVSAGQDCIFLNGKIGSGTTASPSE
jgi:YVTN family beta-propeller protein